MPGLSQTSAVNADPAVAAREDPTDECIHSRLGMINVRVAAPAWRGAARSPGHSGRRSIDGRHDHARRHGAGCRSVLAAFETPSRRTKRVPSWKRLARIGANLLTKRLRAWRVARSTDPQDPAPDLRPRLTREMASDLTRSARYTNAIRGLQPWPMASVMLAGKRVLLLQSELAAGSRHAQPGTVIRPSDALVIAAGDGAVRSPAAVGGTACGRRG
jgi:hypothetical protein